MLKLLRGGRVLESLGHEDEIDFLKGAAARFGAAVVSYEHISKNTCGYSRQARVNSDNMECRVGRTVWHSNGVEDRSQIHVFHPTLAFAVAMAKSC